MDFLYELGSIKPFLKSLKVNGLINLRPFKLCSKAIAP
jgi:hypothetical protein